MLQSSTVLNFRALRQRTQAIQPIIYRCHELSLQRIDLAVTSESSHWSISSSRRSRQAHVIAVNVQSWPCGWDSCLSHSHFMTSWRCYRGLPSRLQNVHWPNYKFNSFANWNRDTAIVFRWQHVFRCYTLPSNMDIGSEDIDRQLNKVKIFQCLSVHIHAYKIRILGGTKRRSGHHSHNTFRRS